VGRPVEHDDRDAAREDQLADQLIAPPDVDDPRLYTSCSTRRRSTSSWRSTSLEQAARAL
jgi:hypothetical protein